LQTLSFDSLGRRTGVLLHVTSLPGPRGIGELGAAARAFLDWLARTGATVWQFLPLSPPSGPHCPYISWASTLGNPAVVDLEALRDWGLLTDADLRAPGFPEDFVDFDAVLGWKLPLLQKAASVLLSSASHPRAGVFARFQKESVYLQEPALFQALRRRYNAPWWQWPQALRDRVPDALKVSRIELGGEIDEAVCLQFFFESQWADLRAYARQRGIYLFGDVPIYVDLDSCDVWMNREQFYLDSQGSPTVVAGVPPDYFSEKGQLWSNPLYRWDRMAEDDYAWWRARLGRVLCHADFVRIDHFRGLSSYWEIPAWASDARTGVFRKGPGRAFFEVMRRHFGPLPLIAEDLGMIDEEVISLRQWAELPGMKVLQFAFGGDATNPHLPHNHSRRNVVYLGTHDNDTTRGYLEKLDPRTHEHLRCYLSLGEGDPVWNLIRVSLGSVCDLAVITMQDLLGLGSEARMNNPATVLGNWRFRIREQDLDPSCADRLRDLNGLYGRLTC